MKIIRRVYTYLIALISLEIVIWGTINLLRTIFAKELAFPGADTLSMALALILVGIPVFLGHWLWIKKNELDPDEKASSIRALFYYGAFAGIFVPVAQNLLALIDRWLLALFHVKTNLAFVGGQQSTIDNLIAIVINVIIGLYLLWTFAQNKNAEKPNAFKEVHRLHDHLWIFYGLAFIVFGSQKVLRFILLGGKDTLINIAGKETVVNGIALLLIGVPLFILFWRYRQARDAEKEASKIRLGFLFILSFIGIIVSLVMASLAVYPFLLIALKDPNGWGELLTRVADPVSIGLPIFIFWTYFHGWLKTDIATKFEASEKRGISRFYTSLLAIIGLIATLVGISLFISIFASIIFGMSIFGSSARESLAGSLATLISSAPLWLTQWRRSDAPRIEDRLENSASITRRAYLYIAIFGTVIASMVAAINLAYNALFALFGEKSATFGSDVLSRALMTINFLIFAIYHWQKIRADNQLLKEHEQARRAERRVTLVGYQPAFVETVISDIKRLMPEVNIRGAQAEELTSNNDDADELLIISAALNLSIQLSSDNSYIQSFESFHTLEQINGPSIERTVEFLIDLLNDKKPRTGPKPKAWQVTAYVMASLFLLEVLFTFLTLVINSF